MSSGKIRCEKCQRLITIGWFPKHQECCGRPPKSKTLPTDKPLCDVCGREFKHASSLRVHMQLHSDQTWPCEKCGKVFQVKSLWRVHQKTHNEEKPFVCNVCGKRVKTSGSLAAHMKTHDSVKQYRCEICNVSFTVLQGLRNHNTQHHSDVWHECDVCKKKFRFRNALKVHVRSVHQKVSRYFCDVCGKGFYLRYKLDKHKRQVHNKRRQFACTLCTKSFRTAVELQCHQRSHNLQLHEVTLSNTGTVDPAQQFTIITDAADPQQKQQHVAFVNDFGADLDQQQVTFVDDLSQEQVLHVEDLKDLVADVNDDNVMHIVPTVDKLDMQYADHATVEQLNAIKLDQTPHIQIIPAAEAPTNVVQHIFEAAPAVVASDSLPTSSVTPKIFRLSIIRR